MKLNELLKVNWTKILRYIASFNDFSCSLFNLLGLRCPKNYRNGNFFLSLELKWIMEKPATKSWFQKRESAQSRRKTEKEGEIELNECFIFIKLNGRDLLKIRQEYHLWYQNHAIWALYSQTLYKWSLTDIIPTETPISTCYHIAKFAPWDFSLYKLPTFTQKLGAWVTFGEVCQISISILGPDSW